MDEIFGGREAQRQQTEKEAGGDTWRGMEITKRRRGRDREIITDPETEKGMDGYTKKGMDGHTHIDVERERPK